MKTIYQCEMTGKKFDTAEEALASEAIPLRDMKDGNFINKESSHEPKNR